MQREYYLDNSATTPISPEVSKAMEPYWAFQYGNPSSPHQRGVAAEKTLRSCRQLVAELLGARPTEIVFTGSGTESNNLALQGFARSARKPGHIITSAIEHPSVIEVVKHLESLGWEATYLPVSDHGEIEPSTVAQAIKDNTSFISLMMVNNELGTRFPISQVCQIIADANKTRPTKIFFHVDAIQALGKVPISLASSGIDFMSLSGHKIFGPKGVGALFVRRGTPIKPMIFGGGQEHGLRSGTENVPLIAGLTKAVQASILNFEQNVQNLETLRCALLEGLTSIPDSWVNSPKHCAPHLINVGFSGVRAEILVHFLEQKKIYVSMGAACSGKSKGTSHVLQALGLSPQRIREAVRISLAPDLPLRDIEYLVSSFAQTVNDIREIYQ